MQLSEEEGEGSEVEARMEEGTTGLPGTGRGGPKVRPPRYLQRLPDTYSLHSRAP